MKICVLISLLFSLSLAFAGVQVLKTPTGIPLDTSWKVKIYDFAKKNVIHPSWGITHSERNYHMTMELARQENMMIDEDVLFVASFLHDIGGIAPHEHEGVDHGVRSTQVIEPVLASAGFPMEKWPEVKEMIIGHVYYKPAQGSFATRAFRDADILDFLGTIGAARIFAITQEPGSQDKSLSATMKILQNFVNTLPAKCSLKACHKIANKRQLELLTILKNLDYQSLRGTAL